LPQGELNFISRIGAGSISPSHELASAPHVSRQEIEETKVARVARHGVGVAGEHRVQRREVVAEVSREADNV